MAIIDISILLPSYKSEKLLDKVFIPSLSNWKCNWELILRDNGGNGNIKQYESENIKVIGNGDNVGLNVGLNECAAQAKGKYFYLPHTDMFLLPNSDLSLLKEAKNLPPASFLLCSRSIEKSSHTPFHVLKSFGQDADEFKQDDLMDFFKTYKEKDIVTAYRMPFFMDRHLWKKMNGVDPNLFSYATDNDLFFTAYDKGVRRFWMIQESVVYHLQGKSNGQQKVDKDSNKPYEYVVNKWKKYNVTMNMDQSENNLVPWNVRVK
jgi:GT2 family glycosyltransferase